MATVDGYGGKSEAEVSVTCVDTTCGLVEKTEFCKADSAGNSAVASEDTSHGMEVVEEEETAVCRSDVKWF
jgi:hypothetical protein